MNVTEPDSTGKVPEKINRAFELHQKGLLAEAEAIYRSILRIEPQNASALHLMGVIEIQVGRPKNAVNLIKEAVAQSPNVPSYYSDLGLAYQELKLWHDAVYSYNSAIDLDPQYADAYSNRGNALQELKLYEEAIVNYDKAIQLNPNFPAAYSNRGLALHGLKQYAEAIQSYEAAIGLRPSYAKAYSNLGLTLQELKELDVAVESYETAIRLDCNLAEAYANLGSAFKEQKQFSSAISNYQKAIELKPKNDYWFGMMLHLKMLVCDWENIELDLEQVSQKIQNKEKVSPCFPLLALPIELAQQKIAAEIFTNDKYPYVQDLGPVHHLGATEKIRIGYYSADFHNHATTYLIAQLFELHDQSQFEIFVFSYGPDIKDEMRLRLSSAVNHFIDVTSLSDKAVAQLSRDLGILIAVDLKGLTQDTRLGIFSFRAAPIQVSYLGYPGTLGAEYMDYLIADKHLIPDISQQHYSEKIAYLPHSYQVNDRKRVISNRSFSRQELGLPEGSFVFCCFNNNFKITPEVFDSWCRILKAVPSSTLWLFAENEMATVALTKEAEKRGIPRARVVFASRISNADHLARYKMANLFLDTWPCNAHTTASDALWAGVPVLTYQGESFAARVASSLLMAIGLPELVTSSALEYESLAIELATNHAYLNQLKEKLEKNRLSTPLFDASQFTKNIEKAYLHMNSRYQKGLKPDHIDIEN